MTTMLLEKSPLRAPEGRIAELADQCVQCGLCLPVCPTATRRSRRAGASRSPPHWPADWPTRYPLTLLAQQLEQPYSNQESP
ncbi:4Fe-4S binding protein [Rhodanobacter soli]|uniref:4Fe-4S binding protein n=1 Tax=Rhodanobacter soli TaxID=590609 RepID=UPI0031DD4FE9